MPQMTSALDTQLTFMPMQPSDMRAVMSLEAISHSHPWTQGNFLDSLTAGHWAYCIRPEMTAKAELAANLPALWGYCILYPAVDELHLLNITIDPILRRNGIGSRVMQAIEGIAIEQKMSRIILEVRPSNIPAVKLYERMGYAIIGVRRAYYPADEATGIREDAGVMAKSITLEAQ
ncbi:MAG: ribosomal-protein-alanine N-acetyltransferase [Pseudomonadota bacterium]|jgi:ribosomal-protein-alanine N-acetyltransferase